MGSCLPVMLILNILCAGMTNGFPPVLEWRGAPFQCRTSKVLPTTTKMSQSICSGRHIIWRNIS
jgi:hypothetical protein